MSWRPVLDGALATRARRLVDDVVVELARRDPSEPSLGFGVAGIALLHGYRARDRQAGAAELATDALSRALAGAAEVPWPWLFTGYGGIGFALHHLSDVVGEADDTLAELDALITRALATDAWGAAWELPLGVIGLGVYGLERGSPAMVARAVDHLGELAEHDAAGTTWRTFDEGDEEGYHNLGVAHGVAGAIGFLAEACAIDSARARAVPLLREAVRWLRSHEQPEATPSYGMTIGRRLPAAFTGILDGWCYGEPSTALVLVRAGQALGDRSLVTAGHELARRAARRAPAQLATLAIDSAICHGAIGHAHIYHRLGLALDDDELLTAAVGWYARTLDGVRFDALPEVGLQLGVAGIALGVLAGCSAVEPGWDRMFLLG